MRLTLPLPAWLTNASAPASAAPAASGVRVLRIDRAELARARAVALPASLAGIVLGHACTALRLASSGVRYLQRGDAATTAYRRMTTTQFAHINGRQAWANWRTIPRSLTGRLPIDRPLRVIDLCCGTGESTRALAWWLPRDSQIIGYEQDPRFAAQAAARRYVNRQGDRIAVDVRCASVLETFRDRTGQIMPDGSVDVVHAIGSIGCHFPVEESRLIIAETTRVLAADGLAFLDAGAAGTPAASLAELGRQAGLLVEGVSRSWAFDRYVQLAMRKRA